MKANYQRYGVTASVQNPNYQARPTHKVVFTQAATGFKVEIISGTLSLCERKKEELAETYGKMGTMEILPIPC